jgi:hypothetical protein
VAHYTKEVRCTLIISPWHNSVKCINLNRTIRQLSPQNSTRMHPPINSKVPIRLERQLIDIKIDIPISTHSRTIRPQDSRIPEETMGLTIARVKVVDCILFRHELVDFAAAVAFETVGVAAALAFGGDIAVGPDFGEGVAVSFAEIGGGDRVECLRRQRRVIGCFAVCRQLETVESFLLPTNGHTELAEVEWFAEVGGYVVGDAQYTVVLVESAPGFAGLEVDHDHCVAAFVAAVD